MDGEGFYAFLIWTALVAAAGFGVGQLGVKHDLRRACIESGEIQMQSTFYSCEPVGSLVSGKRIAFKKAYRE